VQQRALEERPLFDGFELRTIRGPLPPSLIELALVSTRAGRRRGRPTQAGFVCWGYCTQPPASVCAKGRRRRRGAGLRFRAPGRRRGRGRQAGAPGVGQGGSATPSGVARVDQVGAVGEGRARRTPQLATRSPGLTTGLWASPEGPAAGSNSRAPRVLPRHSRRASVRACREPGRALASSLRTRAAASLRPRTFRSPSPAPLL
jgi:hypothetical protein